MRINLLPAILCIVIINVEISLIAYHKRIPTSVPAERRSPEHETGKMSRQTTFEVDDHRQGNRQGEWFNRGETFSGLDYETGLQAVEELRSMVPTGMTMTEFALRWILMSPQVTCAIPGAKRVAQVEENVRAADQPPLSEEAMAKVRDLYERLVRPHVHHYW